MTASPTGLNLVGPERGRYPLATWVRLVVVAALFLLLFWPMIRRGLVMRWIHDANWSHGWLIPAFSLYFLFMRREALARAEVRPHYLGAVILTLSLALYFVSGWWLRMGYPQELCMISALLGVTLLMGGWGILRIAWFPILFLLLAIPLPQSIYVALTMQMQKIAAAVSAAVLPLLVPGLHTEAQAVVIDYILPGHAPGQLNVEEACSGMRSAMAFAALGIAMAYLYERPFRHRLVMVLSCVPIAILCNAIRVTITGWLQVEGYEALARGSAHELLGIVMFVLALGLFTLIGYVLSHLWIEVSEHASGGVGDG